MSTEPDRAGSVFEEHRRYLFAIAYRMLGSVTDAEDMVQETFVRWHKAQPLELRSPRAWLTTVTTRLCINHLKSARVQREEYVGPWLPEPVVGDSASPDLDDSLSMAFLVVLENLTPTERAVFLLRDVFDYEFADISRIVRKTPANCRQILARARQRVASRRPSFDAKSPATERLLEGFVQATARGDVTALMALLDEHATLVTDGGGKARALVRPIEGAGFIARALIGALRRFAPEGRRFRRTAINGLPGLLAYDPTGLATTIALGIAKDRIHAIYIVRNPDKLRHLSGIADAEPTSPHVP
jgi:RNA polymerase sigma-70 factor (ECF subfamily)